jgi:hypothetical protein
MTAAATTAAAAGKALRVFRRTANLAALRNSEAEVEEATHAFHEFDKVPDTRYV